MSIADNLYKVLSYLNENAGSHDRKEICQATGVTEDEFFDVIRLYLQEPNNYLGGSKLQAHITSKGKQYLEHLPEQQERSNLELQRLRTDVQLLTNNLADYDKVKRNAKWGLNISIISAIAIVIATIIAWIALTKK